MKRKQAILFFVLITCSTLTIQAQNASEWLLKDAQGKIIKPSRQGLFIIKKTGKITIEHAQNKNIKVTMYEFRAFHSGSASSSFRFSGNSFGSVLVGKGASVTILETINTKTKQRKRMQGPVFNLKNQ